jgi:hypothetical protein
MWAEPKTKRERHASAVSSATTPLHWLLAVKYLSHQIVTPLDHAKQKLDAGHGLATGADAGANLNQMLLGIRHIILRRCRCRAPEPGRKTLAGALVTGLKCTAEIAPYHIRDHAGTKGRH